MQTKRCFVWFVILALLVASVPTVVAQEKVTLHYFSWATTGEQMIREDTIEPFQKLYPHIEFIYEAVPQAQYLDKLITYHLSGNPPDLVHMSVGHVYDLARMGMLTNLQPWFDRDLDPDLFFMDPMKAVRYPSMEDGDLYGIPFAFVLMALFYNKDLFDEAGLVYPDDTWTFETLRQVAPRMTRDISGDGQADQWGFWTRPRYDELDVLVHSYGGRLLSDDLRTVEFDSPEAIAATRFLVDLMWKDRAAPTPQESAGKGNLLSRGYVGMAMAQINAISTLRDESTFAWDIAMVPAGPEKRVVRLWPDSYAIPANSKNQEAAWEYIKFAIQQEEMDRYSGERKVPIYKPLAVSPEWLEADKAPNKNVFINSIQYGHPLEFRPAWDAWNSARTRFLNEAWNGSKDPGIAVMQAAEAMQIEIDRFFASGNN